MAYREIAAALELALCSPALAQSMSEMPQSSSPGSREAGQEGARGVEAGASEPGQEGGERAPGAGQGRSPLARSARFGPLRPFLSPVHPLTRFQASRADGPGLVSCHPAAGRDKSRAPRRGERRRVLALVRLSGPTWSQALPGRSRAPELGCFSPPVCSGQQGPRAGFPAHAVLPDLSPREGSSHRAPPETMRAETQTPPAHLYGEHAAVH